MSELKEKMKSYNELRTLEKEIIDKIIEQVESIEKSQSVKIFPRIQ